MDTFPDELLIALLPTLRRSDIRNLSLVNRRFAIVTIPRRFDVLRLGQNLPHIAPLLHQQPYHANCVKKLIINLSPNQSNDYLANVLEECAPLLKNVTTLSWKQPETSDISCLPSALAEHITNLEFFEVRTVSLLSPDPSLTSTEALTNHMFPNLRHFTLWSTSRHYARFDDAQISTLLNTFVTLTTLILDSLHPWECQHLRLPCLENVVIRYLSYGFTSDQLSGLLGAPSLARVDIGTTSDARPIIDWLSHNPIYRDFRSLRLVTRPVNYDGGESLYAHLAQFFSSHPTIEEFDIYSPGRVLQRNLRGLLKAAPNLKRFGTAIQSDMDDGYEAFLTITSSLPRDLTKLELRGVPNPYDGTKLKMIAKRLPKLEYLELNSSCYKPLLKEKRTVMNIAMTVRSVGWIELENVWRVIRNGGGREPTLIKASQGSSAVYEASAPRSFEPKWLSTAPFF